MSFKSVMLAGAVFLAGAGIANAAVVQSDLNLRSGPGTGYGVVAVMPAGAQVDVLGCSGSWCRVAWGGAVGYASASYIGGGAYVSGPVYAAAPPVVVAPPVIGFGFGWGGGWHGRWHRHHHWHHHH
ncbi:MAG TPA: SH3 domain-containing protein [Pseudolabrys sp.]|jgi:uncharacterized protein YraI|nr:SH3 domain-containing protein [Pseudolabrys sp.]